MLCKKCNQSFSDDQRFCTNCSVSMAVTCPQCGSTCEPENKFCANCGFNLVSGQLQSSARQMSSDIIGTHHVSILCADIKGSTSLVEKIDPEEAHILLKPVINAMIEAVNVHHGTVIHTAGDGLAALFGAPEALEDHALQACLAAIAMQENVKIVNPHVAIRIGLSSGTVLLDIIGSGKHKEYDALGTAVNLAAKLEQTAQPGHIQLSQSTLDLVGDQVKVTPTEPVLLKGYNEPVKAYNLQVMKNKS